MSKRVPCLKAFVTLEVFNPNGKRVHRRKFASRSFVEAFLSIVKAQIDPAHAVAAVADVNGADRDLNENEVNLSIVPAGNVKGVVVGTGSTAVVVTDFRLEAIIGDAAAPNNLVYGAQVISDMTISDPSASFTIQRDFTNSSGGSITVNEIGIYGDGRAEPSTYRFMLVRDLVSGGQAVPDGYNLRITYTVETST